MEPMEPAGPGAGDARAAEATVAASSSSGAPVWQGLMYRQLPPALTAARARPAETRVLPTPVLAPQTAQTLARSRDRGGGLGMGIRGGGSGWRDTRPANVCYQSMTAGA